MLEVKGRGLRSAFVCVCVILVAGAVAYGYFLRSPGEDIGLAFDLLTRHEKALNEYRTRQPGSTLPAVFGPPLHPPHLLLGVCDTLFHLESRGTLVRGYTVSIVICKDTNDLVGAIAKYKMHDEFITLVYDEHLAILVQF